MELHILIWFLIYQVSLNKINIYYTIKITHAEFPFSFYVINSTNNYLSLSTGNIFFEEGNYNAIQFQVYVRSLLPTNMTFDLNIVTGRFILTYPSYFYINPTSNCGKILGFNNGSSYYSVSNIIELPYPCNFTLQNLYIKTPNLLLENYNTQTKDYNTLRNIQINTSPFGIILYENKSNNKNLIKNIDCQNSLTVQIYDDYGNFINFNGVSWTITIQLESAFEFVKSKNMEEYINNNNILLEESG
jgi:hypothetical protein